MKGTYTIIVDCRSEGSCVFGELGRARLRKGLYLYTGSALGRGNASLERRLERHARPSKKKWWHIDYLTSRPFCCVSGAVYIISTRRLECRVSRCISEELNVLPVLPRIGASDCNCEGHLLGPDFRLGYAELLQRLRKVYRRVGSGRLVVAAPNSD